MVVLEGGGVVTIGNNQYLQPDYLSPLPTTLDAKKSPLALLAQTCSQIGADSSSVKPLLAVDKSKKNETSKSPSGAPKTPKLQISATTTTMSPEIKHLAFKPYEANVLTTRPDDRPPSKANSIHNNNNCEDSVSEEKIKQSARAKSISPQISVSNGLAEHSSKLDNGKNTPNTSSSSSDRKSASPSTHRGASPIIRSGMEVLQGHPKDSPLGAYKPGMFGLSPMSALCCPPGMEQHTNPAFRPPFAGGFSPHHAALLAAAAAGYPTASQNPYVSYARVKTPSGGEALVPVCKDPYCTGCQFSAHNQQMMMGAPCPSGCTQCEHQKYGLAMAAMSQQIPPGHPYAQLGRPYICNWMAGGDGYCGKRFGTSDELLQHVRSHTPNINDPNLLQSAQQSMMNPLGSLFSPGALHRTYPTPPLSPMSAARYHPYGKPGQMPASLQGSPYAAFNPAAAAALGSYYSPYAMYGQRLGAAAVHP